MTAGPYLLLDRVRAATADEYIIEGELARGGMAAVFLGRDIALDRRVAIKVMLPDLMGVAGSQDRFVVEARTGAQLDHPGIVTVYAVKQRAGLTFIVMKYIEGRTLEHAIATRGALDPIVVATIGSHVAEALHFAHSQGVVHRDVKPSNIIIDTHGRPVVTDFGIAKVSTAPSLTIAGMTVGTPSYMSPEQCRGHSVTAASDQYSLGVVLYEMLTGRPPFSGTLFELLTAHTSVAPPPIRDVKPDVDPALEAIVMIMLAKNETERFPSLRDVSKALVSLVPRRSQAADRQAIMAAIAPDLLEERVAPPKAATPELTSATPEPTTATPEPTSAAPEPTSATKEPTSTTKELTRRRPEPEQTLPRHAAPSRSASATKELTTATTEEIIHVPPVVIPVADATGPRSGRGKQVVGVVVAAALLAAVGYAIASRAADTKTAPQPAPPTSAANVDSVAPAKAADSISAAKPETSLTVRADTATPPKRDTTAKLPSVAASKSSTPSTKTATPKTGPKRDSASPTRPDSVAARCAALNLKFSLGEEVAKADTVFLRRECAKYRPRAPGL